MPARNVLRRSTFDICVIIGCTILSILMMSVTNESNVPDTAVATLAAAIIGIAGTSLGHTSGHHHGSQLGAPGKRPDISIMILLIMLVVVIAVTVFVFAEWPEHSAVSKDAAAALCVALLGISGTVIVNETLQRSSIHVRFGQGLLMVFVIGGGIAVVGRPFGLSADDLAALAAAGVGVAGTLLGHERGRALAKSKSAMLVH
jgi:hypothetical protein